MKGSRVRIRGSSTKGRRLPAVDDHFVAEGARVEVVRGRLVMTPPADEPHAKAHLTLAYVLGAHVARGWLAAVDMLTRAAQDSDFAPDASVYPEARDPETGGRRLEELAFEIASTQPLRVTTDKARGLTGRGVRRVFCILVKKARVLEWSGSTDAWSPLAPDAEIADRCFARPLRVAALLDAASADAAVVAALDARFHPAIAAIEERGRAVGRAEGRAGGLREALLAVLEARGLAVTPAQRQAIDAERDPGRLRRWISRAGTTPSVARLLRRRDTGDR